MKINLPRLIKTLLILCFLNLFVQAVSAQTVKGNITDASTGETLIGATVHLEGQNIKLNTNVKLDGVYEFKNVPAGTYQLQVSYIGYKNSNTYTVEVKSTDKAVQLNIAMLDNQTALKEVSVVEHTGKNTDQAARAAEKNSSNIINAVSAQAIAISPDVLISNVLSRMSGISIDRSNTGDAQHVIIRGMDKQYNTTLINGIKIPSPENKNRYIPLDIFPAGLVDQVHVEKSLTADMEGDASGGVVNLIMKSAPDKLVVEGDFGTGYNQLFFNRSFETFDRSSINDQSPGQRHPGQPASIGDFPYQNLLTSKQNAPVNKTANLTIGNRFLNNKLGVMFSGSYQNLFQGDNSFVVVQTSTVGPTPDINTPNTETAFQSSDNRQYSSQLTRMGAMTSLDYKFDKNNSIKLFGTYVQMNDYRVRETQETTFGGYSYQGYHGTFATDDKTQTRVDDQKIYNITLSGKHNNVLIKGFSIDWTGAASQASQKIPDMAEFDKNYNTGPPQDSTGRTIGVTNVNGTSVASVVTNTPTVVGNETRVWQSNTDKDLSGYLNLHYRPDYIFDRTVEFSIGGMIRHKTRDNFQDKYTLDNTLISGSANPELYTSIPNATFYFPAGSNNPYGSYMTDADVYTATEDVHAIYGMIKFDITSKVNIIFGVRGESTSQSWVSSLPSSFPGKTGNITYNDLLPSINAKYALTDDQAFRASYFRSIYRPNFYDLIPATDYTQDDAFYEHSGNPYVQHTVIDNYDVRYEFFPGIFDELMIGAFYKHLNNPIETGLGQVNGGATLYYSPQNFAPTAQNFGAELVATKYFGNLGASINYTYTNSKITTPKEIDIISATSISYRDQTRPLQGQAGNIGNFSILYKDQKQGIDAQLSLAYTGERLAAVSKYYGLDTWEKPSTYLDFSAQKKIGKHFIVFVKANNLLNTPFELFIKQNNASNYSGLMKYPHQESPDYTTVQYDLFYARYSLGVKYNF